MRINYIPKREEFMGVRETIEGGVCVLGAEG